VSATRLIVGLIIMALAVPATLYLLLELHVRSQLFTLGAVIFIAWGVADLLASILERPRLKGRSPGAALKQDLERRSKE
jgi:hypothetical protein